MVVAGREERPEASAPQPQVVAAVPLVPALPVVAAVPQPVPGSPAQSTQRGPDVIRVSIGRVEVRAAATLPSPPQAAPPAAPAAPVRVSLQGYLRGEREAR